MNANALALGSLLAIGGITAYRLFKRGLSSVPTPAREVQNVKTVWASSALALVISFMTDIDAGLGAAFGVAIAFGLAFKGPASAALAKVVGKSSSSSGGAGTAGAPASPAAPPGFSPTPLPGVGGAPPSSPLPAGPNIA